MNRIFFLILSTSLLFSSTFVEAQGFDVDCFHADYYIHTDGSFDVVEQYDVNFQTEKHGIYRTIPLRFTFRDSLNRKTPIKLEINNIETPNRHSTTNNFFLQRVENALKIKIGDQDKTVSGLQYYDIHYAIHNGIIFDSHQDYFYWNIKTTEWSATFKKISFAIYIPEHIPFDSVSYFVYSGSTGNMNLTNDYNYRFENHILSGELKDGETSNFTENLTVLIKFPKGYFPQPNPWIVLLKNYLWIAIIFASFLIFFILWLIFGRDRKGVIAIQYYPPDGIDSAMAGYLINDKLEYNDLISLLPYFGSLGYLSIEEIKKETSIIPLDLLIKKLKPLPSDATDYEKSFFNGLFYGGVKEVKMSQLVNKFYLPLSHTRSHLTRIANTYYEPTSSALKKKLGCWMSIFFFLLIVFSFIWWGIIAGFSMIAAYITLIVLNIFMRKKNKKGDAILADLKGFEIFIHTAELSRLEMLLKDDPYYFEKTMPYALAFGALDDWAQRFENLQFQSPNWYKSSSSSTAFSAKTFGSQMNSSMHTFANTAISSPAVSSGSSSSHSSSGGGFSGGGGGGGGGGSW